ncbi:MAG: DUF4394 domain-containing protein [Halopseudomonas sp.]|uniref:DUF4394 domain-containing protein n=1 Tax=Halopseudomonas sp. TaxID=2901191 RepID=UPI003002B215
MNTLNKLILTTSLTLAAGTASAAQLLALSEDGMLHKIETESLSVAASMNVEGASNLRGIDVRPANGMLYALGGGDQLYTLDPTTGKATAGAKLNSALPGSEHAVVDFNPKADRLRLLAADGTNYRVNVETGEVATDGSVAYAKDFEHGDMMEKVVAGAYTDSYAGTEKTELYTIDLSSGMLMLQDPPNDGVQKPVGELAKGLDAAAIDIASDGKGGNTAYVLANGKLHTVDLKTGKPTVLGEVDGLSDDIIDIAVWPKM